ncbi:(d)CMP kinase [Candidatus Woesebacteria bacterium]|nr:(d)CMP kinase [Candidatus Woesebacteria bacterium]
MSVSNRELFVKTWTRVVIRDHLRKLSNYRMVVDGPAAAGKGTLGRRYSEAGAIHLSFGLWARTLTYLWLQFWSEHDGGQTEQAFKQFADSLTTATVTIGAKDLVTVRYLGRVFSLTQVELRSQAVTESVPLVAGNPHCIAYIEDKMEEDFFYEDKPIFLEGRDMWRLAAALRPTNPQILVTALYLAVSDHEAARRAVVRAHPGTSEITDQQIGSALREVQQRNEKDYTRVHGTLLRVDEAVASGNYDAVLQTNHMNAHEVFLYSMLIQSRQVGADWSIRVIEKILNYWIDNPVMNGHKNHRSVPTRLSQ